MTDHEFIGRDEIEDLVRQYGRECADTMASSKAADPDLAAVMDPIWREVETLRATVNRVWDLHAPVQLIDISHGRGEDCGCEPRQVCRECGRVYPCPTLLDLDREATAIECGQGNPYARKEQP